MVKYIWTILYMYSKIKKTNNAELSEKFQIPIEES